jgi:DnaJ-class molecular chaperone
MSNQKISAVFQTTLQPPDFGRKKAYEALDCPWCGGGRTTIASHMSHGVFYYAVRCQSCGAQGPECKQSTETRAAWERRMI